jgi:hypothetical protein
MHFKKMGTWTKVKRGKDVSTIPLKWVYTYKLNADGTLARCKARIVVRGDLQSIDKSEETYAATLTSRAFRIAIALAAQFGMDIMQYDIKNAFTHAVRTEDHTLITCELPPGFKDPGWVIELNKALYGLRDSPLLWFQELSKSLNEFGLEQCAEEPCLFYSPDRRVYVVFFVDDILILNKPGDKVHSDAIASKLRKRYEMHEKGSAEWFLGIEIIRDKLNKRIYLSHRAYIEKIAAKFGCDNGAFAIETPLPTTELTVNKGTATKGDIKYYQQLIGSLLYTAVMVRPDIAFAASFLSRFLTNPSVHHIRAAKRVIGYLFCTRYCSLCYGTSREAEFLIMASDASHGDDLDTRRSTQGYIVFLYGGPIVWKSTRQATVTTSSTEAELLAVSSTAREAMALRRLFAQMRIRLPLPYEIFCDNQQTIRLVVATNARINTKLRHIDIHNMWLRQEYQKGSFQLTFKPSKEIEADGLTKNLPKQAFKHFISQLRLVSIGNKERSVGAMID